MKAIRNTLLPATKELDGCRDMKQKTGQQVITPSSVRHLEWKKRRVHFETTELRLGIARHLEKGTEAITRKEDFSNKHILRSPLHRDIKDKIQEFLLSAKQE